MLYSALMTLLGVLSLAGWGNLVVGRFSTGRSAHQLGVLVIYGLLVCGAFALILNFIVPLSSIYAWGFLFCGAVLAIQNRALGFWGSVSVLWRFVLILMSICAVGIAVDTYFIGDSGLYHIQAVLWQQQQPLTIGLANIHERLGLNSFWWGISAILNPNLSISYATDISNSVLLIATSLVLLPENKSKDRDALSISFLVILYLVWGKSLLFDQLGSPGTDLPASLLWITCSFLFFRFALCAVNYRRLYLDLFSISVLGTLIKFSSFPMALCLPMLFFLDNQNKPERNKNLVSKGNVVPALLVTALFFIWMARNYLLSSCWLFPAVLTCYPKASWAVPHEIIIDIYQWIRSWARIPTASPESVFNNLNWTAKWWDNVISKPFMKVTIGIWAVSFLFWLFGPKHVSNGATLSIKKVFPLYLWMAMALTFWFLMAPDLRFGGGIFVSMTALSLFTAYSISPNWLKAFFTAVFILAAIGSTQDYLRISVSAMQTYPIQKRLEASDFAVPVQFVSKYGVVIWTPNPSAGNLCWFAQIPCTPYPRAGLRQTEILGYRAYSLGQ